MDTTDETNTNNNNNNNNVLGSSPVDALCRELRRQYGAAAGTTTLLSPLVVVAAAAAGGGGGGNYYYHHHADTEALYLEDPDYYYYHPQQQQSTAFITQHHHHHQPHHPSSSSNINKTGVTSLLEAAHATANICDCRRRQSIGESGVGGTTTTTTTTTAASESSGLNTTGSHLGVSPPRPSLAMPRRNSLQRPDTCPHCGGRQRTNKSSSSFASPSARLLRRSGTPNLLLSPHHHVTTAGGASSGGVMGGVACTSGAALMMTDEPAHVRHFLQDTPQLRFLRSTLDMNAAEPTLRLFGPAPAQKTPDYQQARLAWKRHQRAANELANLLWTLSHEMSLEDYGTVESKVFSRIFAMVHGSRSMAGLAALTALLEAPSADEERRCIKFAYTLSQALRNGAGDFEFLQATATALGRMAQLASNVDFDLPLVWPWKNLPFMHRQLFIPRRVNLEPTGDPVGARMNFWKTSFKQFATRNPLSESVPRMP
eukprot:scaffold3287_cov181-Amphora_coffeaeformis.AAC.1